ncbi:type VI secretion system Vgr family protein [Zoogloea sp.]|uniref:type VI secretion system Vgr family protein n=1 Tax=Zoogloea sp. TaxID=49181 RepID=UPI0035B28F63
MSSSLASALSSLLNALSQANSILRMRFPEDAAATVRRLVPYQAAGTEAICDSIRYRVQCLADDNRIDLADLLGQPVALSIGDDRGGRRLISGIVTSAEQRLSDGSATAIELVFEDALSILRQHSTWRVFCETSVVEITEQILAEHIRGNTALAQTFKFVINGLQKSYPKRAFTLQAGESDHAFLTRLWRQEGIAWSFQFSLDKDLPQHTLRLTDHPSAFPDNSAGTVRFHRADATEDRDTVVAWRAWQTQAPSVITRASFDYKTVRAMENAQPTLLRQGKAGDALASTLTDYHYDAPQLAADGGHYDEMGRARILAHEFAAAGWRGESVVRQFAHATIFSLAEHPEIDAWPRDKRKFTLTRVQLYARNNIPLDPLLERRLTEGWDIPSKDGNTEERADAPIYYNRFECVQQDTPVVPIFSAADAPRIGILSAIVVGAEGNEIDVDEHGRVAVRFPFARPEDHPNGYGTSSTPRDSARIRVMQPWADNAYGAAFWPRVGSEVLVGFMQGDPSKPIVLGAAYNGTHEPPRFSGYGSLPANSALYGLRSKEIKGSGYNQLRFDDTSAQISAQLSSDYTASQLNLGWLGKPRQDGQSEARGEGFELASDSAGALRAAKGLLLSAWSRFKASGAQLDRQELLGLMEEQLDFFKQIGDYAAQYGGKSNDNAPQSQLHDDLKNWDSGSNTAKGGSGGGKPLVAVSAPAGVYLNSPEAVVTHAGKNVDIVAGQHLQSACAGRHTLNTGQGIALFAQSEGIKILAHDGKLELQSQHGDTQVNASQNLKLSASEGKVQVMATEEILLAESGGAYIKLTGGRIELGCPGDFTVKAASHQWSSSASSPTDLPKFSSGDLGRTPVLVRATDGQPISGIPYSITRPDGSTLSGHTDADGKTTALESSTFEKINVQFFAPDQ